MKYTIINLFAVLAILTSCKQNNNSTVETAKAEEISVPAEQPATLEDTTKVESTTETTSQTGAPAYMNVDLKGYKTQDTNLSSFYGEVIFVNYWGSWCPPCRMEMPSIQSLYDGYKDKVKFVTIAFERQAGKHTDFIDKNGYTFPVYEATSPLERELRTNGYPTTLIIDKQGKIVAKDVGAADWNAPAVHEFLDKLIAAK